jgi:glycosyltransferase involved in cell wall biosynthesis
LVAVRAHWRHGQREPRIYDDHGVFLFPSFFEEFGKAFLESMSRGLVLVASNNGGMRDVIKEGQSGLLSNTWRRMADESWNIPPYFHASAKASLS